MSFKIVFFSCLLVVTTADRVIPGFSKSIHPNDPSRQGRIIGGTEAKPYEFPYIVTLGSSSSDHFCGGGIIAESWIITVAHCQSFIKGDTFQIKAGKHSLGTVENTEQVVNVAKFFAHKKYPGNRAIAPHDIALLKLEKPLVFNQYVQPIALPQKGIEVTGVVVFSGWGTMENHQSPDKLRRAEFNIVDFVTCQKIDEAIWGPPSDVTDTMLCAGPSPNGVFACPGDSGSPLIKQENNKSYLVGVFSWLAKPCGEKGFPSVFTKVSSYIDWLQKIIANN